MGILNDYYYASYSEHIRTAFSGKGNRKNFRYLMHAIRLFNKNKAVRAIKVLEHIEKECKTSDDFCAVLMVKALCYEDLGYVGFAIMAYEKLLTYDDNRSSALSNLGRLYVTHGDYNKAIDVYSKAIGKDASNVFAFSNMANLYYKMGEHENALKYAVAALKIKGNLYQASNCACLSSYALGDNENGKKYYGISIANGVGRRELDEAVENAKAIYNERF